MTLPAFTRLARPMLLLAPALALTLAACGSSKEEALARQQAEEQAAQAAEAIANQRAQQAANRDAQREAELAQFYGAEGGDEVDVAPNDGEDGGDGAGDGDSGADSISDMSADNAAAQAEQMQPAPGM